MSKWKASILIVLAVLVFILEDGQGVSEAAEKLPSEVDKELQDLAAILTQQVVEEMPRLRSISKERSHAGVLQEQLPLVEQAAEDWKRSVLELADAVEKKQEGAGARLILRLNHSTREARKILDLDLKAPLVKEGMYRGRVEVTISDLVQGGSRTSYHLSSAGGKKFRLYFARTPLESLASGDVILLNHGVELGGVLASEGGGDVTVAAPATPEAIGEQKVLAILVDFSNQSLGSLTSAGVDSMLNGSVNSYFREQSFGLTSFTCTVKGPYHLSLSPSTSECPSDLIYQQALQAVAPFVHLPDFNRIVIIHPELSGCAFAGLGTVGSFDYNTPDGPAHYSISWINGARYMNNRSIVSHEFGHNLGVHHSTGLDCGTRILTDRFIGYSMDSGSTLYEYGDVFSQMGSGMGHFTPEQKWSLGWIPDGDVMTLGTDPATFGTTMIRTIQPLELAGAKLLRIQKQIQSPKGYPFWYTVDNREAEGVDRTFSDTVTYPNALSGALVRLSSTGDRTLLLDMTPETRSKGSDFFDAALQLNQLFTDFTGIRITPLRNIGNQLEVQVSLPAGTVAPQPEFLFPSSGEVLYGTTTLIAQVLDDRDRIDQVRFYKDGQLLREVTVSDLTRNMPADFVPGYFQANWDTRTEASGGVHTLEVRARDSAGLEGVGRVTVTVNNTAPRPTITSPAPNAVARGVITINVDVWIPETIGRIQSVSLYANGQGLGQDNVAPYSFQWDTTYQINGRPFVPDGSYNLSAVATSWDGHISGSSAPVPVIVDNVPEIRGDADGNGSLDLADVNKLIRWLVGLESMPRVGDPLFNVSDVDCNGEVNLGDVNWMVKELAGIDRLPCS